MISRRGSLICKCATSVSAVTLLMFDIAVAQVESAAAVEEVIVTAHQVWNGNGQRPIG